MNSLNLRQCIVTPNFFNIFLDLYVSNFHLNSCDICHDPLVKLHLHYQAYTFNYNISYTSCLQYNFEAFNFRNRDYQDSNDAVFNSNWYFLKDNNPTLDLKIDEFYSILFELITCFILTTYYSNRHCPPWFDKEMREAIKLKLHHRTQWNFW